MILRYDGHAMFELELENGKRIVTDPYGAFYQYPQRSVQADVCLVSHDHHDHNAVDTVHGAQVYREPGRFRPFEGLLLTGLSCYHDEKQGALRGENVIFVIEAEGLRVVHMGDLGHLPDDALCAAIGRADVLLLPVGGHYTIDATTAARVRERLAPRVTIPMHYRTRFNPEMPVDPIEPFLKLVNADPEPMKLCRLTAGDIGQRPAILRMSTPEGV